FNELLAYGLSCCDVDRTVEGDDAAEGGGRVGLKRLFVRFKRARADRHTAWVGVLYDDASGGFEATNAFPGCVGISNIVVRQLFALRLCVAAQEAGRDRGVYVEGG